jgi:polyisoprenoid-binding protein YceI
MIVGSLKVNLVALLLVCAALDWRFEDGNRQRVATDVPCCLTIYHETTSPISLSEARAARTYVLDSSQSKFIARAFSGGLLWFKGHDHLIAVREFSGEAQMTPDSITPASLRITAKTASMVETRNVFTEPQKQIINKELREIVLLPDQYPEIVFQSTNVSGTATGSNQYNVKIVGNLTLHGVTRQITIPTKVTLTGNDLKAQGEFSINRSDFNVKATSAVHGLVRVRDRVKFEFDIVGHQR